MHFHQWCVGIYGHEIVSQVRIDRRTVLRVVDRVLQKRHPNSHHNCAFDLVAPGQRIDDPSAVNDGDDTVHTQASRRMLPGDFDKVTAVRVHRNLWLLLIECSLRSSYRASERFITATSEWPRATS